MLCAHATQHSNGVVLAEGGALLQSRSELEAWDQSRNGVAELALLSFNNNVFNGEAEGPRALQLAWTERGAARLEVHVESVGLGLGIGFLRRKVAEGGMVAVDGNADLSKGGSWPHHGTWGCALLENVRARTHAIPANHQNKSRT